MTPGNQKPHASTHSLRPKAYKRILIFNVNWLGDVLFSTATIRNIRRNFPDSFIACVVPPRCYGILRATRISTS